MLESEHLISFTEELRRKNPPIKWILAKETEQLRIYPPSGFRGRRQETS